MFYAIFYETLSSFWQRLPEKAFPQKSTFLKWGHSQTMLSRKGNTQLAKCQRYYITGEGVNIRKTPVNVVCEWPTTTQKNPYFVHQTWKYNLSKKQTKFWHVKRSIEIFKLKIMLEISKCFMMRLVLVFFYHSFPIKLTKSFTLISFCLAIAAYLGWIS